MSALFRNGIINFYSKFWKLQFCLYLLNRLFSQNSLPFAWKPLSGSFEISKNSLHSFSVDVGIFLHDVGIIQIFAEKHFPSNFWTADPLNMIDPSFLAFWEIYILITH